MSRLTVAHKTFLEAVLDMSGGYVLDFTDTRFAQFLEDLGIDIFEEKYAKYGPSTANRLRIVWQIGSDGEVAAVLNALADYLYAKNAVGGAREDVGEDQIARSRAIAQGLGDRHDDAHAPSGPVAITTEATVTDNKISIVIHEELYSHISPYLRNGDFYHAVEESYKLVREKLRDLTGKERASDVLNNSAQNEAHYEALFGKALAVDAAEADFFRGVGYLHLGVQHLRNEKAHTEAHPLGDLGLVESAALTQLGQTPAAGLVGQTPAAGLVAQPLNLVVEDHWTARGLDGALKVVSLAPPAVPAHRPSSFRRSCKYDSYSCSARGIASR